MAYKQGQNRYERTLFPDCIDDYVEADAPVRLFDAFVDNLDMVKLEFKHTAPNERGNRCYAPGDLLKLYIYGYFYEIRSSRKLARACKCNIELMWMLRKLTPDFRTISDFRKDNKEALFGVFKEFNKFCLGMKLFSKSYISIDGSKFKACNAKDKNFTMSKLDDRIKRLDEHIAMYLEELEAYDTDETRKLTKEELLHKIEVCKDRKDKYEGLRHHMEETGASQVSLTDPDARLMKQNEGFGVCYNVQTAVDAESHLIAGVVVTNAQTDHGLLTKVAEEVKANFGVETLEATADKGYESPEDHADALASGIIPIVIRRDGGCEETIEYDYNENDAADGLRGSTKPEDLRTCLEAGVIPDVYKDVLRNVEVVDTCRYVPTDADSAVLDMTAEEMAEKAKSGYYVRDAERNLVYCPMAQILRQKSIKRNGNIRYCNRLACKRCNNRCTKSSFKEVDFSKDTLLIKCKNWGGPKSPDETTQKVCREKENVKKVRYILRLDQAKMDNRKCLSEHPFGTIKRSLGHYYFLLRGSVKVMAEMALYTLSYNLRRAINLRSVPELIAAMR